MKKALCILVIASACELDADVTGGDNVPGRVDAQPFCSNESIALTLDAPARLPASTDLQVRGTLNLPRDVTALALNIGIRATGTDGDWSPDMPVALTIPQFATWSATIPASEYPAANGMPVEVVGVAQLNCGTAWAASTVVLVPAPTLTPSTATVNPPSMVDPPSTFKLDLSVRANVPTTCRATPTRGIVVTCGAADITMTQSAVCGTSVDVEIRSDAIPGTSSTVTCRDDLGQQASSTITIYKS